MRLALLQPQKPVIAITKKPPAIVSMSIPPSIPRNATT
jgi:hypothetical protein